MFISAPTLDDSTNHVHAATTSAATLSTITKTGHSPADSGELKLRINGSLTQHIYKRHFI